MDGGGGWSTGHEIADPESGIEGTPYAITADHDNDLYFGININLDVNGDDLRNWITDNRKVIQDYGGGVDEQDFHHARYAALGVVKIQIESQEKSITFTQL